MGHKELVHGDDDLRVGYVLTGDLFTRGVVFGLRHLTDYGELRGLTGLDGTDGMLIQHDGVLFESRDDLTSVKFEVKGSLLFYG